MILSHKHRFVFIKGVKVAGTSVEIALSQVCGPEDIITPITPADEPYRLGTSGEPRNYSTRLYPSFLRTAVERRYIESVRAASTKQFASIRHPRARFNNHMGLAKVIRLVPQADDYQFIYVERSPYAKVMSLANWREHSQAYVRGQQLGYSPAATADAVDRLIANGTIRNVLNIDRYRDSQGRIRAMPWKCDTLADDLAEFLRSRGLASVPLVHAKRGLGSDAINASSVLRPEQIRIINDVFADEFATFDWPLIG
jgi:hypothetical protein